MRVDTKLWVFNQDLGPLMMTRLSGAETFILRDDGAIGYINQYQLSWYFNGELVARTFVGEDQLQVPRIILSGEALTVNEWIDRQAYRLIGFASGLRHGNPLSGTLHLVDLWAERNSNGSIQGYMDLEGIPSYDLAIVFSPATLDTSKFTSIPEYLGWRGIHFNDENPEGAPRTNRYSRPWVI